MNHVHSKWKCTRKNCSHCFILFYLQRKPAMGNKMFMDNLKVAVEVCK